MIYDLGKKIFENKEQKKEERGETLIKMRINTVEFCEKSSGK